MLKRFALISIIVCITVPVLAAQLTESTGGTVNGGDPGPLPATLQPGQVVHGPATIKTDSGDTLILGPDGVLEVKEPVEGIELFFLREGALRGDIGEKTQVSVPTGWLGVDEGQRAQFYARSYDAVRGFFQVRSGTGVVVYEAAGPGRYPVYSFRLQDGQSVEIWNPGVGDVGFLTGQDNQGDVFLSAQITTATEIQLMIPKATAGALVQQEGNQTQVLSEPGSWKGGQIRGEIFVGGNVEDKATLGPSATVLIDNITGKVLSFDKVNFEIIKRSISLTSEFTAVATSNFFGLKK
jgi:hypothetical protein